MRPYPGRSAGVGQGLWARSSTRFTCLTGTCHPCHLRAVTLEYSERDKPHGSSRRQPHLLLHLEVWAVAAGSGAVGLGKERQKHCGPGSNPRVFSTGSQIYPEGERSWLKWGVESAL